MNKGEEEMGYKPPFAITPQMLNAVARISELVGTMRVERWENQPQLRRQNRIKTIAGTLAIEGNTLTEEQITAILDGKHVMGSVQELAEVQGAIKAYEAVVDLNPFDLEDLLRAHELMMGDVLVKAGVLRTAGVGIQKGSEVVHVAPPADRIWGLLNDLLHWAECSDIHLLIKSSVFHYEFEFIHPFADGNGRLGRLWQTRLLADWHPLFLSLPLESVVRDNQQGYYDALTESDQKADCTSFITFMLDAIEDMLLKNAPVNALANAPLNFEGIKTPEAVIECVRHHPAMTRREMATLIGKDVRTIGRAIKKLQEAGRLKRRGADKTGHWELIDG